MTEKKKIFVLLFSLILYCVPQGIYWYYPKEFKFIVGIPWYLFRWETDVSVERLGKIYTYSGTEVIGWQMLHMRLFAYACMIVTLVLLVEHIYQMVKKIQLKVAVHRTVKCLVILTTIQFICSLIYCLDWFVHSDTWKWMQGITLIQMVIARAFQANLCGNLKDENIGSAVSIKKIMLYIWFLCYGIFGTCFVQLQNEFRDDAPIRYSKYSAFGVESPEWLVDSFLNENGSKIFLLILAVVFVFIGRILLGMKEKLRRCFLERIEWIQEWITVIFLVWIAGVCLFAPQMRETTWYFKPDLGYSIFLSMGCWRLLGAGKMTFLRMFVRVEEASGK